MAGETEEIIKQEPCRDSPEPNPTTIAENEEFFEETITQGPEDPFQTGEEQGKVSANDSQTEEAMDQSEISEEQDENPNNSLESTVEHVDAGNETEEETQTAILNIVRIEPENDSQQMLTNLAYTTNTDGNLQINTYTVQGEEVHEIALADDDSQFSGEYIIEEYEMSEDSELVDQHQVVREVQVKRGDGEEAEIASIHDSMLGDDDEEMEEGDAEENVEEVDESIIKPSSFKCNICDRLFKTNGGLVRHVTTCHTKEECKDDPLTFEICVCCGEPPETAHKTGDLACDDCDFLFINKTTLERHRCLEHPSDGVYKCSECMDVYTDKKSLEQHIATHATDKPFKCDNCNRRFARKFHLDRHITQIGCDGGERPTFTCQVCGKVYNRKDNLREHLRGHAGEPKKKNMLQCHFCNKTFNGPTLLAVHVRTHTGERPYACDMCDKRFPTSGAMTKHRRCHTGEKPYECSKCQRRFAAKETLNRHVKTHSDTKPYNCQFCGKSFIQAWQLRAHVFHHTGENALTCPHCNRAFTRLIRLTTHIKFVHEGEKPLECDQCSKTFFRNEDLARHKVTHSGEKKFFCDICNKGFTVKSVLKIHMNTHRKEPPCSCDECGRAFIRQDCLMRHMRAKHRDVLEDIMAGAEKKRLQQQLLSVATEAAAGQKSSIVDSTIWNELTLTDSIKELLTLLVDNDTLKEFGWPDCPVDKLLDSVIRRCGHRPASEEQFDYLGRLRENAKLLFTAVIDDEAVKSLLNNQTVDEVIMHVLRLARNE